MTDKNTTLQVHIDMRKPENKWDTIAGVLKLDSDGITFNDHKGVTNVSLPFDAVKRITVSTYHVGAGVGVVWRGFSCIIATKDESTANYAFEQRNLKLANISKEAWIKEAKQPVEPWLAHFKTRGISTENGNRTLAISIVLFGTAFIIMSAITGYMLYVNRP